MSANFTKNTICLDFAVASAMNSITPVAAFSANAHPMIVKSGASATAGMRRPNPSSRRSITALAPTTMPRPAVCIVRIIGYAQMESEPTTQAEKALF